MTGEEGGPVTELDALDRAILERLQTGVPLVPRPFAAIGKALGLDEGVVLARVRRLRDDNIIRQIGAILDTRRLGYHSTLVACHVPQDVLANVAARVSAHPGVSHNYARPHHYNLWFTLAVPPGPDLDAEIRRLARQVGVDDWLSLPALRVFKIWTHFRLEETPAGQPVDSRAGTPLPGRQLTPGDVPYLRALQADMPLVPRPFSATAGCFGLDEGQLLERARELEAAGIVRRIAAVLRHSRVGYAANGMACWTIPQARIEEVGRLAAGFPAVSHCYQRPAYPPRWPYTLFTMIHGRTAAEVEAVVAEIAHGTGIDDVLVLYSTHEFKKERIRFFEEET
jgi:DNA-binding Lrp family transcriptional regulator